MCIRDSAGADPGRIMAQANRLGGRNKYGAFGEDLSTLVLAEVLANASWLAAAGSAEDLHTQIVAACREARLGLPRLLSTERTDRVRTVLKQLARRWKE